MPKYSLYSDPFGAHTKMVELVGKNKRVLEVGCASGYVSKRLKENDCVVCGIEIDPDAAKIAEKYCENVFVGDVEKMKGPPFKPKEFDVILFGDVLEHLKNPEDVLINLKEFLKDDGSVITSIPNIAYWSMRLKLLLGKFEYTEHGILDSTHLRFFNYTTARRLLERSGLKIIQEDFVPPLILPFLSGIVYRLSKLLPNLLAFQFIFVAAKGDDQ